MNKYSVVKLISRLFFFFFFFFHADINECVNDDLFNCTDEFHVCVNTRGSYKCVCGQNLYFIDGKCRGNMSVQRRHQSFSRVHLPGLRSHSY